MKFDWYGVIIMLINWDYWPILLGSQHVFGTFLDDPGFIESFINFEV